MSSRDLLGERAAILGLAPPTSISSGGSSRILAAADGWWALTLVREDDIALAPALVGDDIATGTHWEAIADWGLALPLADVVERTSLLGLPAAAVPSRTSSTITVPPLPCGSISARVLDLSSLWAGPLTGQLLLDLDAEVTKAESTARPDGARAGNPEFFRLLNEGKREVSFDLSTPAQLLALIAEADIVIESARPRALRQLGIVAEDLIAARSGLTWVSITAYGRASNRVGFGDDVAAGAGLLARQPSGVPHFVGDAVADPLTGIAAAHAALSTHFAGGGLVEVSMYEVCRRQVLHAAA